MAQATAANIVEREVLIEASPAIVYSYFTDSAKIVQWMGSKATLDPRPGGEFRLDYNGFDRMKGEFVELVPNSRIVFTWGWETLGTATPPGASTVRVTLSPEGTGTRLKLVHVIENDITGAEAEGHAKGWDMFLGFLQDSAKTGKAAQPARPAPTPSEEFASRLNAQFCDLRYLIEGATDQDWKKVCRGSGWSVGVTANHVVAHGFLGRMAAMIAAGDKPDIADVNYEALAQMNAESAKSTAGVTRAQVLEALLRDGPPAVELVKSLDPATLGNTQVMAFAGGVPVSAAALLEGPLLGDVAAHIADIRAALAS